MKIRRILLALTFAVTNFYGCAVKHLPVETKIVSKDTKGKNTEQKIKKANANINTQYKNLLQGLKNKYTKIPLSTIISGGQKVNVSDVGTEIDIIATAYSISKDQCGKTDGITASGVHVSRGQIACGNVPFGTKIKIPELDDEVFVVTDRGNPQYIRIDSDNVYHIDIYMENRQQAEAFGIKHYKGIIYK